MFSYDEKGNMVSRTWTSGSESLTWTYAYEPNFSQVTAITDPLSHTATFGYDSKGNLTSVVDASNVQTTYQNDASGRPLSVTTSAGTTSFAYTGADLTSVTDPLGNTTLRSYDPAGRLTGVTDALGNQSSYSYDGLSRLTGTENPLQATTSMIYDGNGNLLSLTDERQNSTSYTYEAMNRVNTRTDPKLAVESYEYDLAGNLTQFVDRKQQAGTFTYDGLNRLSSVVYPDATVTYTYDAASRLIQVTDSVSGTITRAYDGFDRLLSETAPQGLVSYTYDAAGRRTTMSVSGSTYSYAYDAADRLIQVRQGTSIVDISHDSAGRRSSVTYPNGIAGSYAYDAASRLTGITYTLSSATIGDLTYEYDGAGRRTRMGGSLARTGLPGPVSTAVYDEANRLTQWGSSVLTYDANGNLTADGANGYTWDARNRLASMNSIVFQYDAFGRRTLNAAGRGVVYDGLNPVVELSGSAPQASMLMGLGLDEMFSRKDSSGVQALLTDALGSVVALADSTGSLATQYTYEPFGKTTASGAPSSNPFQYTGRENDGTGLYYYRARYYDPQIGRFISEDPIRFQGSGTNFYAYVNNDPVSLADPLGLCATNDSIKQKICSAIPSGRTIGASGGVGVVGSPGGGGELVVNYDSGQVSAFAFGGFQVGWNGVVSGSAYSGFVYGLNNSNTNYSGGFTGANGVALLGGFAASSSGGFTGGAKGLAPNGAVEVGGISLGATLLGGLSGGVTATNYSKPAQLGKYWAFSPVDWLLYAARRVCK